MVLKCELCGKKFKKLEDAFIHPYSLFRPRIVHRPCINHRIIMFSGFRPFLPITTVIEMAAPSIVFLIIIAVFFLLLLPTTEFLLLSAAIFSVLIVFRLYFLSFLFKAKREFDEQ